MLPRFATCSAMLCSLLAPSLALAGGPFNLCDRDACLVTHSDKDSDGDGVSDADEIAAGTDPNDPESRPRLHELLDLIRLEALPSFGDHHSFVVVLPMLTPAGKPVFGGLIALPGRTNTLSSLGIDPGKVDPFQLANGLTIGPSAPQAPNPTPGTPPLRMGGIGMALIADGDVGGGGGGVKAPPMSAIGSTIGAAHGWACPSELVLQNANSVGDDNFGTMRFELPDVWPGQPFEVTDVNWQEGPTGYNVTVTRSEDGIVVESASQSEHTTKDEEGVETKTKVTTHENNKTGTKTSTSVSRSSDGNWSRTVTSQTGGGPKLTTTHKEKPDGSKEKIVTKENPDGSKNIQTTETDPNGSTRTTDSTCDASGNCQQTDVTNECDQACQDALDGKGSAYTSPDDTSYDPSANNRKLGIIPTDMISAILAVRGGNITYGDTGVEADGEEPVASTPDGELIIHVEEDPTGFGNGGVGFGTGLPRYVPEPRFDPRLPNPLMDGAVPTAPDCIANRTC